MYLLETKPDMSNEKSSSTSQPDNKPKVKSDAPPSFLIPIFKLPIILYRLRLGWLLGRRFAQITHVGRRSGKQRKTILAVLRFDPQTHEVYTVSAWKSSDWFYNIQASPALQVEVGSIRFSPVQRTLSPEEITTTFIEYRKKHPFFSRLICRIPGWKWDSTYEEFLELAKTLHGVSFAPKTAGAKRA